MRKQTNRRTLCVLLAPLALALIGCTNYASDRVRSALESGKIHEGMAYEDVVKIVGREPDYYEIIIYDAGSRAPQVFWQVEDILGHALWSEQYSVNGELVTVTKLSPGPYNDDPPPAPWLVFQRNTFIRSYPADFNPRETAHNRGLEVRRPEETWGEWSEGASESIFQAALRGR